MRTFRLTALLACALAVPLAWSQTAPAPAAAASAPAGLTVRPELRTFLLDAQALINEKKFPQAKEKLNAANAITDKTPVESYLTARVGLAAAIGEDDATNAALLLEQILKLNATGAWLKPEEKLAMMQGVGIAHYRVKDYAQAASWMDRNVEAGGTDQSVKDVRIQSYLLIGNFSRANELLNDEMAASEKAQRTPPLRHLQMMAQARHKLKDIPGYTQALEWMVQHYPSKESWQALVNRLWSRSDLATRLQLDVLRLSFFTTTPEEQSDYADYIDFAQKAGLSSEALSIFDKGVAAGLLATGPKAEADKKLRAKLAQETEQDRKTVAADTAAALKKPDGLALFNLGLNLVGTQQYDKGIELMEKGIAKGMAKRPEDARLRLAVVYAQAGQTDKALKTFATVSGPEGLTELARYWTWAIRKT
ncbi:MAG: hypothetical protein V4858_10455 [Pseudomonadota bacterium]